MTTDRPEPPYAAIPDAWASLTPEKQAELGASLIEWVLADFVHGGAYEDEYQYCDEVIRLEAMRRENRLLNDLPDCVRALLPGIFGAEPSPEHPDGGDPPWAWRDRAELLELEADMVARGEPMADRLAVVRERLLTIGVPVEPHDDEDERRGLVAHLRACAPDAPSHCAHLMRCAADDLAGAP